MLQALHNLAAYKPAVDSTSKSLLQISDAFLLLLRRGS
jgi:hypothetical protein